MAYLLENMELLADSGKAIRVQESGVRDRDLVDGLNRMWIPRSQIIDTDLEDLYDVGYVEVKAWWARKEDWPDADECEDDEPVHRRNEF